MEAFHSDLEPSDEGLRLLAFQMRSSNFGCGGRVVVPPTPEELLSLSDTEISDARRYYQEKLMGRVAL